MKMKKTVSFVLTLALAVTLTFGWAGGAKAAMLELDEIYTSYGLGQSVVIQGKTDLSLLMLYIFDPTGAGMPLTITRTDLLEGVVINIGEDWMLGEYIIRIGYGSEIVNEYHFDVVQDPVRHTSSSQSSGRVDVVTNVTLTPANLSLEIGQSAVVKVNAASSVRWETDDADLISISGGDEATITAKKAGTAVAWAYSGNNYATLSVKIVPPQREENTQPDSGESITRPDSSSDAFSDLAGVEWAKESINALARDGVVNGIGDGTFAPENNVTRAEFVKMIVTAFSFGRTGQNVAFSDVAGDEWYAESVYIAAENNIVNGYDGKFSPLDNISCQDAALILKRVADARGVSLIRPPVVETEAAEYARDAVALLRGNRVIDSQMGFSAGENATRAQSAYMIYNIYKQR